MKRGLADNGRTNETSPAIIYSTLDTVEEEEKNKTTVEECKREIADRVAQYVLDD